MGSFYLHWLISEKIENSLLIPYTLPFICCLTELKNDLMVSSEDKN